jgi:hypothetical protein
MLLHIIFVLSGLLQNSKGIQNPFQNAIVEKKRKFLLLPSFSAFGPSSPSSLALMHRPISPLG